MADEQLRAQIKGLENIMEKCVMFGTVHAMVSNGGKVTLELVWNNKLLETEYKRCIEHIIELKRRIDEYEKSDSNRY